MPFTPIVFTEKGDALTLPEVLPLLDHLGRSIERRVPIPTDLEALQLGHYPYERMLRDYKARDPRKLRHDSRRMLGYHLKPEVECFMQMDLVPRLVLADHFRLYCPECPRLVANVPPGCTTYGQLRQHFSELFDQRLRLGMQVPA